MVKLRVVVRVIPEDGYLASLRTGDTGIIEGERKFAEIVRDPADWYIGTLARVVEESYKRRYRCDLGKIKYLKAEDDCDLDPEDLVSDHFIDEGRAARDGADQTVIFKVIQEQGRALRTGSVIPDLTPVHYAKPLQKPPVPIFSDVPSNLGKHERQQENGHVNSGSPKRMRLQGIEEEQNNTLVHSIEADEVAKSPELEIQDSQTLQSSSRDGDKQDRQARASSPELGMQWLESAQPAKETSELFKKPGRPVKAKSAESKEKASVSKQSGTANGNIEAASTINGVNSNSPAQGQSRTASAKKFQNRSRGVYAAPDSDIEDSQMSPRSLASTARIAPRLVGRSKPSKAKNQAASMVSHDTPSKITQSLREEGTTQSEVESDEDKTASESDSQVELDKENQGPSITTSQKAGATEALQGRVAPNSGTKTGVASSLLQTSTSSRSKPASGRKKVSEAIVDSAQDVETGQNDLVQKGTPNGNSKKRKRRYTAKETDKVSAKNTPVSATKKSVTAAKSAATQLQKQIAVDSAVGQLARKDSNAREGSSDIDSPGAQLSQSLQEYTPKIQINRKLSTDLPGRDSPSINTGTDTIHRLQESNKTVDEDVTQSGHTSDEVRMDQTQTELAQNKSTAKRMQADSDGKLRCFTCWKNKSRCDNEKPKCGTCIKYKRICREYDLTKQAAEKLANNKDTVKSAGKKKSDISLNKITVPKDEIVQDKSNDQSPSVTTATESEEELERIALTPKGKPAVVKNVKLAVPTTEHATRAESTESQVPASRKARTLPDGMTEEEYDRIVQSRAGLTEEQRIKQLRRKASTPALTKTPSRDSEGPATAASNNKTAQTATDTAASDLTSAKVQIATAPKGRVSSATPARSPSVIPPAKTPTPVSDPKPKSAKKPQPTPAKKAQTALNSESAAKTPKPAVTPSTIASTNKNNPPFKRQDPKSATPSAPMTYSDAKSIKQVRELAALKSAQASASNSPRSSILLPKTVDNVKGKGANFLDEDDSDSDDDDDESDEESEDDKPDQPLAPISNKPSNGLSSPSRKPGVVSKEDESDSESSDTDESSDETSSSGSSDNA